MSKGSPDFAIFKMTKVNKGINYEHFKYRKHSPFAGGEMSFRCMEKQCLASLRTCANIKAVKSISGVHNHPAPVVDSPASMRTPESNCPS